MLSCHIGTPSYLKTNKLVNQNMIGNGSTRINIVSNECNSCALLINTLHCVNALINLYSICICVAVALHE